MHGAVRQVDKNAMASTSVSDPDDGYRPGLEGVVAFRTEIAEPDRDGGALRYRGVNIEDLAGKITFGEGLGVARRRPVRQGLAAGGAVPDPGAHR